ncbi:hypothetical protein [Metallosphaera hakonensis]|uniref:Uncharacterized protein n=1 Tax=Metallosphaera hakonensis JCM 8857 = DSM 7519 TaxID=1293036 RepID=A0A2U9IWJ8_9CREN|nr:hypothetical protein [Metallosphaera hakonensis]AWS00333.1 hypothetical protein DFR87_12315 [Metallosphaera hakonensis JCM 8857 = DSM 7519]
MVDICRLSESVKCTIINLDELITASEKHADLLVYCNNIVIVIEETRKMKSSDITQILETLNDIRRNKDRYGIKSDLLKFVGLVHFTRGADPISIKLLLTKTGRDFVLDKANCCEDLIRKIEKMKY